MIYVFSGTGNTLHAANLLGQELGLTVHQFTADELRNPDTVHIEPTDGRVVWMFPTYSWGIPPVVRDIIRQCTITGADTAVHHAVTTCGDDVGNLAKQWHRDIEKRGWTPGTVYSVEMPNTYVMMSGFDVDSPEVTRRKLDAMDARIADIASKIVAGNTDNDVVRGSFGALKTLVIYPWFTRRRMSPRGFKATDACVGCGLCARSCPMDNITIEDERPTWGDACAFCTACYHACPHHAVAWRRTTLKKGQKAILKK